MSAEQQVLNAAASLFSEFAWARMLPGLSLALIVGGVIWVTRAMHRDQTNAFDVTEFMRDDTTGKLSIKKVLMVSAFGAHAWFVWIRTTNNVITWDDMALFAAVWSGSPVLLEGLAVWKAALTKPDPAKVDP